MTNWTQEREAAARARCDAANPATWGAGGCVVYGNTTPTEGAEVCDLAVTYSGRTPGETEANCEFIAHARKDLPDALDENQRLRKELIEVWPHRALRCPCSERQRARDIDNPAPWTDCTCGLNEALYAVH